MTADLHTTILSIQWIIIAYLSTQAGLTLGIGRGLDILGPQALYPLGLVCYGAGCLFSGLAPALGLVLPARVLQGIGASIITASGPAIMTAAFPSQMRGRALGLLTAGSAVGGIGGPVVGGLLIARFGWRAIFLFRVPLSWTAAILAQAARGMLAGQRVREPFDYTGAVSFGGGLVALVVALALGQRQGWWNPLPLGLGGLAVLLLAGFVLAERRAPQPVLDPRILRNPLFVIASLAGLLASFSWFSLWLLMPYLLSEVLGLDAVQIGLLFPVISACSVFLGPVSGWMSDRFGPGLPSLSGQGLIIVGLAGMAQLDSLTSLSEVVLRLVVIGTGMAFFIPANSSTVMGSLSAQRLGVGSAILALGRTLGAVCSVPVYSSFYTQRLAVYGAGAAPSPASAAYRDSFLLAAGVAAIAWALTLVSRLTAHRERPLRRPQATPP